jgi:hypothetical protein
MSKSKPSFQDLWDREGGVPGITADSSAVLPWGSGSNANELGWRRQIRYGDSRWALFDCGMVDFLVALWGVTAPFVHWREQQRRWLAGLDPETGEPDPYVQDFLQWPAP